MAAKITFLSALAAQAFATAIPNNYPGSNEACNAWERTKFKSLVSFGDSYTDDSRLSYFINNNGSAPPVGWVNPANYNSASGGRPWPQYVKQYAGLNIYNYAVSGAVCSNTYVSRFLASIHQDFPDVEGYEIPAFLADKAYEEPGTGKPFLDIPTGQTVYSMWIGTNDLGVDATLTDSQTAGQNITTYIDCVYAQLERLYASGARYFVLQNVAPLQLAPLYGLPDAGGITSDNYWPDKPANITEISYRMLEQVVTVNEIYALRTPVEVILQRKFPGANFALFSMNQLISDIYYNPSQYLNGTAPLSTDGVDKKCDAADNCTINPSPDSYLWYDDLHPSEQADRNFAREFLKVIGGSSKYATYYSG